MGLNWGDPWLLPEMFSAIIKLKTHLEKPTEILSMPRQIESCPWDLSIDQHKRDDSGGVCPLLCGNHVVFVWRPVKKMYVENGLMTGYFVPQMPCYLKSFIS